MFKVTLKTPSAGIFYGFQLKVGGNEMNYITVDNRPSPKAIPIYFEESFRFSFLVPPKSAATKERSFV